MTDTTPTVFIVDDEQDVLKGLSRLFRSARMKVETFDSPRIFLDHHAKFGPGCLVLDLAMPDLNGIELQRELTERDCLLPIIFLTGRGDIPSSVRAMKGGAVDFLTKPVDDNDLLDAVRRAIDLDLETRRAQDEIADVGERLATLTPREREVMIHVVAGRLNKQIAADLGTVEKTIKVHRARVMTKMKVGSLAELVRIAERAGIDSD